MSNSEKSEAVIYTPASPLAHPWRLIRELVGDVLACRELATRLLIRNISARYRQSLLGYFWAVFPMVATTAVWLVLSRNKVITVDAPTVPYPLFLLTGMMLWQTFVDAVQTPLRVVTESKAMLAKINFPRESLMFAALGEVLFNFAIRGVIMLGGWLYLGGGTPPSTMWLSPIGVGVIILFGMTIGILLVPLGVLYQDVTQGLALIFQVWLFATPVLYPTPANWIESWIAWVNPAGSLIANTRDWMLIGPSALTTTFWWVAFATLFVVSAGILLYRVAMPIVIERMQS
ncbi:MAG: ABC transporter permease [Alphaproteobacteria bacterium]|nr:MAG: ABC transporter permease [Alphaproteobacteria bacterium]